MNEEGFIKNKKILEENYRDDDLLDIVNSQVKFFSLITKIEESSLVGLVGPYGEGKSNFLNQLKKLPPSVYGTGGVKWFEFDAWKYPERKDLWEAFVLEIAKQGGGEKSAKKIEKEIKGKSKKNIYVDILTDITGALSENFEGINILDKFTEIFKKEPITKVYELQNILKQIFNSFEEKNIYIIIEDLDRSGDAGIYFLETLNHFLKIEQIDKKILCIVPIGTESYSRLDIQSSYIKSLDYTQEFFLRKVELGNFVNAVFDENITSNKYHKGQIVSFLESLFKEFPGQMNMRKLKMILRNSNQSYISLYKSQGEGIDWRLSIMFEAGKHLRDKEDVIFIEKWRKSEKFSDTSGPFISIVNCVIQEGNHIIKRRLKYADYDNVYKKEYNEGTKITKMLGLDYNYPINFVDVDYKNSQSHDSVLFYYNEFPSERSQNKFGIIKDYLF